MIKEIRGEKGLFVKLVYTSPPLFPAQTTQIMGQDLILAMQRVLEDGVTRYWDNGEWTTSADQSKRALGEILRALGKEKDTVKPCKPWLEPPTEPAWTEPLAPYYDYPGEASAPKEVGSTDYEQLRHTEPNQNPDGTIGDTGRFL